MPDKSCETKYCPYCEDTCIDLGGGNTTKSYYGCSIRKDYPECEGDDYDNCDYYKDKQEEEPKPSPEGVNSMPEQNYEEAKDKLNDKYIYMRKFMVSQKEYVGELEALALAEGERREREKILKCDASPCCQNCDWNRAEGRRQALSEVAERINKLPIKWEDIDEYYSINKDEVLSILKELGEK